MFAQIAMIDRKIYPGPVHSLQPFKEKASAACDPPYACWPAIQTTEARANNKKREGIASPWQAAGFVCFPSPYMFALSPFRSDRDGPSWNILKGKARTLAACLSARSVLPKLPSEAHLNLELVWPPFRPRMCNGRRAEAERKEWRSLSVHKPKAVVELAIFFLSVSLSHHLSCSWRVAEERADRSVCDGQTQTHRHTNKPVVISICIHLMLGGGDWKPSLFKWEIQHLLKSMGLMLAAGSEVLMKNHHRRALINPAESHQRCWAEIHDPPGMPNFYGWRHGVRENFRFALFFVLERPINESMKWNWCSCERRIGFW